MIKRERADELHLALRAMVKAGRHDLQALRNKFGAALSADDMGMITTRDVELAEQHIMPTQTPTVTRSELGKLCTT